MARETTERCEHCSGEGELETCRGCGEEVENCTCGDATDVPPKHPDHVTCESCDGEGVVDCFDPEDV